MSLNFTQIQNLLVKNKIESSLVAIITEYSTIKQKLNNLSHQSWYFRQGIEASEERMFSLNNDFEEIRKLFNESTIDFFIQVINKNNKKLTCIKGTGTSSIQRMRYFSILGENEFFNELIRLKSKTELLMPIDDYLDEPDEFLKFIE